MYRLISFIGTDDTDIVPHFLDHYRRLGVREFQLLLHGEWTEAELEPCLSADVVIAGRTVEAYSELLRSTSIESLARRFAGEWILLADADEFLELPYTSLDRTVDALRCLGTEELPCSLLQRATADGTLPALSEAPIDEQFPCYDYLLAERMIGGAPIWKSKYTLARVGTRFRYRMGCHFPNNGQSVAHLPIRGVAHHFKWRDRLRISLTRDRGEGANQAEQSAYLRWLEGHDFRVPIYALQTYRRQALFDAGFLARPSRAQWRRLSALRELRQQPTRSSMCSRRKFSALEDTPPAWRQDDSRAVPYLNRRSLQQRPGRIAIVTNDLAWLNHAAGIGTAMAATAERLAWAGHDTHVFYSPVGRVTLQQYKLDFWKARGVEIHHVSRHISASETLPADELSLRFSRELAEGNWDVIHFHDYGGYAAATLLERAAGLRHTASKIAVSLHAPTAWARSGNLDPWDAGEALRAEMEAISARRADVLICPSRYISSWYLANGFSGPPHVIVPNSLAADTRHFGSNPMQRRAVNELVFFGRVEPRKGIETFLNAVRRVLEAGISGFRVTMLGRIGGNYSIEQILSRTRHWPCRVQVISNYINSDAIDYLRTNDCIAVMPSEIDNLPYTVYECLENEVPFLASDVGGISELVDAQDRRRVLVDGPRAIADRLIEALIEGAWPARLSFDPDVADLDLLCVHSRLVEEARHSRIQPVRRPSISPAILVYGDHPSMALDRLLQSWRKAGREILVAFDSASAETYGEPTTGEICNRLVEAASADVLLFCHTSVTPALGALEALATSMERTRADAIVCGFRAEGEARAIRDVPAYGGPAELSVSQDVYGAAFFLVRKQAVLAVGGFKEEADLSPIVHWELLNRLKASGYDVTAVPAALVFVLPPAPPPTLTTSRSARLAAPWVEKARPALRGFVRQGLLRDAGQPTARRKHSRPGLPADDASDAGRIGASTFIIDNVEDAEGCDLLVLDSVVDEDHRRLLAAILDGTDPSAFRDVASGRAVSLGTAAANPETSRLVAELADRTAQAVAAKFGVRGELQADPAELLLVVAGSASVPARPDDYPEILDLLEPDFGCLIFLEDAADGHVSFPSLDLVVKARSGRALAWSHSLLHRHLPVAAPRRPWTALRLGFRQRLSVATGLPSGVVARPTEMKPPPAPLDEAPPALLNERTLPDADIFFGLHIPKCAGTTLLQRVAACLPAHAIHQTTSIWQAFRHDQMPFLALAGYEHLRFVFGHSVHEEMIKWMPRAPVLFTGLREPIERLRSTVAFERRLREDGYTGRTSEERMSEVRDPMCWFIIQRFPTFAGAEGTPFERARNALNVFSFCYFPDTFEDHAKLIFEHLGIDPQRVNHQVSPNPLPAIEIDPEAVRHDRMLYEWARERFPDATAACLAPSDAVRNFHQAPKNVEALRHFLHAAYVREFRGWDMLEEAIRRRQVQLSELRLELSRLEDAMLLSPGIR